MSIHGKRSPRAVESRGRRTVGTSLGSGSHSSGSLSEGGERGTGASPLPRIHSNDWQQEARCLGAKADLFFPATRGGKVPKEAKQLCAHCPVWRECLKYARGSIASWTWGYYGGLSENERKGKSLQQAIALAESRRVEKAS